MKPVSSLLSPYDPMLFPEKTPLQMRSSYQRSKLPWSYHEGLIEIKLFLAGVCLRGHPIIT